MEQSDVVRDALGRGAHAQALTDLDIVGEVPTGDEDVGLLVDAHQRDRVRNEEGEIGGVRLVRDHEGEWIDQLRDALVAVNEARAAGPQPSQ